MGFEPTTSSLGSWHSTTELRPRSGSNSLSARESTSSHVSITCPRNAVAGVADTDAQPVASNSKPRRIISAAGSLLMMPSAVRREFAATRLLHEIHAALGALAWRVLSNLRVHRASVDRCLLVLLRGGLLAHRGWTCAGGFCRLSGCSMTGVRCVVGRG
jgi:hypothetical protein